MSYDLYITPRGYDNCERDEHGWLREELDWEGACHGHLGECPGAYFNYTYNLSKFFSKYHVNPIHDLDGLSARECAERIERALKQIGNADWRALTAYDAPNGWGSWTGAYAWLNGILHYCLHHPDYRVDERS